MNVVCLAIFITFKRVGMYYCYSVYNVRMVEKCNTPEEYEKKNQKKVL